jgi:hypothetical protein
LEMDGLSGCGAWTVEVSSFGGRLAIYCSAVVRIIDERESQSRILSIEILASNFSRNYFRISMTLLESDPRCDIGLSR